jgi:hypothetical protein
MKARDQLDVCGTTDWIITNRMFKKQDGRPWTGFIWLRTDTLVAR